jgi:hypothetical protein
MKINLAFVSILIIASSLAIHLSTYIQPSHRLWGVLNWAPFKALTPSPEVSPPVVMRRSELGLIPWSSHLPSEVSPPVVMRRSELGLISWSAHLPSEVSLPVVMRRSELGLISWSSHLPSEVSPPVVMRRSELGLISWSAHLLLRCLHSLSCGGFYLG